MDEIIYKKINSLLDENNQAAIATVVNVTPGTPRKLGAKMLVMKDSSILGTVGGGIMEKHIIDRALKVIQSGEAQIINKDLSATKEGVGAVCGGQISIFIEPIIKKSNMFIFGAGHVGKAIAQIARYLDYNLNIIDERPEWANKKNYPFSCKLWVENEFIAAENIPIDEKSIVIILTHSWKIDEGILKIILKKEPLYIGVIGSWRKIKTHKDNLIAQGFSQEDFDRVCAPIGLPIGAYSPHEIALSILAEVIAVQKGIRDKLPYLPRKK